MKGVGLAFIFKHPPLTFPFLFNHDILVLCPGGCARDKNAHVPFPVEFFTGFYQHEITCFNSVFLVIYHDFTASFMDISHFFAYLV